MNLGLSDLSLGMFGSGGGGFISVDFGASSIKVAEGSFQGGDSPEVNLSLADKESVGNPAPNERIEQFSNSLRTLLERNSIEDNQKVVLALPTNVVIVRHLELPAMPDERMSQVIRYEAESHIPFPLEDVVLDYHVIERTDEGTEIILIAVKEEKLNEYVEIAHNAGLDPEIIDISAFSLFNLYRQMEVNGEATNGDGTEEDAPSKVLVDIGHANTDIIIFKGETLHFARSASVAGESITEQIAKKLGVELEEAERLKREYGHIPLEEVEDVEGEQLDEGTNALDEISQQEPSGDEAVSVDDEAQPEEDLDVGAPTPPGEDGGDDEESMDVEPSEPDESEEDSGGIDLGTPKEPDEASDDEPEPTAPEPSEPEDDSDSSGIDLGTPKEPDDAESEAESPSGSPEADQDDTQPADENEVEEEEEEGEGIDLGLGSSRTPSSPVEGESADETESSPGPPEADESGDIPQESSEQGEDEEEKEKEEDEQDTPPAPSVEDEDESPAPPGEDTADMEDDGSEETEPPVPPEPGETESDESEDEETEDLTDEETISLGDTTTPAEEDIESEDDEEDEGEGGDLDLGNTLDTDEEADDGDEEDDDDDDGSSLSLGAAENNEDANATAEPDSDEDRGKVGRAIKPQVDRLIGELRHTFDYFQSQLGGGEVDEIIIVGGGSELKNISTYVEDQLDRPASKFHPEEQINGIPEGQLQSYLVSAGLTLRTLEGVADLEINLIPEDIIEQRQSRNVQKKLTAMGVLGALLFLQILGSGYFFYSSRHHEKMVSQREFEKLESIVNRVESLKERQSELDKRLGVIENLEDEKTDMLALMKALDQLPQDLRDYTWFKNMQFQVTQNGKGELNLTGVTQDFDDTSRIYQWLESIEYIETIENQSQQKDNYTINGEQRKLVSFTATCIVSFSDDSASGQSPEEQT